MSRVFASLLLVAFFHAPASAAAPSVPIFDPAALKLQKAQPNEVLVLGTPHLSQLPKSFDPANLSVLNERLAAWRPDAIAIEVLSGMQCAYLRSYPQRYADAIKSYCWDPAAAQRPRAWMWRRLPCRRSACWRRRSRLPGIILARRSANARASR